MRYLVAYYEYKIGLIILGISMTIVFVTPSEYG